jgi:acyl-CoA synthetase (AMP-forming)/AMP-acid ligase II
MELKSPFPDVDIPAVSVFDLLFAAIEPDDLGRVALIDAPRGTRITYRELRDRIEATAGALARRGIGAGSVVGLLAPNSSMFAIAFHGILRTGATATTINALFTGNDIAKQLADSQATMLITVNSLVPEVESALARTGISAANLIVLDGGGLTASGYANLADLLAEESPVPHVEIDAETHLAVLPYSSGTTGDPKGVKLSHRNLVANVSQIHPVLGIQPSDNVLAVLPFFHIYGMTVLLNAALHARATLVIMPRFELADFLSNIQRYRLTYGFIAPPVAVALAKHPLVDDYDVSSLRTVLSGAAPLDASLGGALATRLGVQVLQGYGMSELSPVSHLMPVDGGLRSFGEIAPLDSCGWAIPNTLNKIVKAGTDHEIDIPTNGHSEPGELWIKGPNVMLGYLDNDQATAETIDADGYLHTGDLATVDSAGRVYIVDRLKELIKYKGYQVPPAELEALLLTHESIVDAAVVGVIDDGGEEIPKAFVVRGPDSDLTDAEVIHYVAEQVAPYKKVRQVEFVDMIPKSAAGKILRKDLRSRSLRP